MEQKNAKPLRVIKDGDINLSDVVKKAGERGVDLEGIRDKSGEHWRRITPLLKRAYAADLLTGENALGELGLMTRILLDRSGDVNAWLLQLQRISEEGGPIEFGRRIHQVSTSMLEENIRTKLGVPKKLGGMQDRKK